MPQFLTSDPVAETIEALGEALDLLDVGVAVLDRDLRVRIVNRRFAEAWPIPPGPAPTVQALIGGAVRGFHAGGSPGDPATAPDRLETALRAGAIPPVEITLADGTRRLLRCIVRRDGGRVLTCADRVSTDHEVDQFHQAHDAAERLAVELRFSNETLESQAAYLASLAEAADANAQAAEEAKRLLEHEVAERRQLEGRLRQMATTDALTGSLNRAQFFALGQREVERVRQQGLDLALLMLDVDHFKAINDRHGHPVGDAALCHLVSELRTGIRRIDLLGRLGGEEFAIVLPAIGSEAAAAVAERLRAHIASHPVPHAAQQIGMTISIGLAMLRDGDRTVEQLVGRADTALYAAKHAGRNRVMCETEAIAA
jgi:diguanylate cyclase (GGDEF)-like protein